MGLSSRNTNLIIFQNCAIKQINLQTISFVNMHIKTPQITQSFDSSSVQYRINTLALILLFQKRNRSYIAPQIITMSYYKSRHYETDAKIGYMVTLDLSIKEWDSDRAVSCLFFYNCSPSSNSRQFCFRSLSYVPTVYGHTRVSHPQYIYSPASPPFL